MTDVKMEKTLINGKWTLSLPEHRAAREHWGTWYDPATGEEKFGWEPERLDSMHRNIGPGDVVFDVGTEEGDLSALYQSWIGNGDGGVVLWEPNPRVWANIFAIWTANDLTPPLGFVNGFAADINREVSLLTIDHWPDDAMGEVISDHGFCVLWERPDIPSLRIDDYVAMTGQHPTIITIDVEGAEANVLEGAIDTLQECKPIVYCSIHPQFMQETFDRNPYELHAYMMYLGFREKHLATDHEDHWVFWHPEGRELRL